MILLRLAAAPLCAILASGCSPSFVAAPRMPDAALTSDCVDPVLVTNPATATDNDVAAERIRVAEAYAACRQKQKDLATFVRKGK